MFLLQTDPFQPKPALRALREAETLADRGWEVVFVSWIKDVMTSSEQPDPYPVVRVAEPLSAGSSFLRRGRVYLRAMARLRDAVLAQRPDLVIVHDFEVLAAAVSGTRRLRAPLIYDSHEDWPALIAENSDLEAFLASVQERRLCRHVDHVVTVSQPIAAKFRAWGRPVSVLYSGRPSSDVRLEGRSATRPRFGYADDDFVVGFAGAYGPGRGLEVLIDALRKLPPNVKALLVGGPEEEAVRLRDVSQNLDDRIRIDSYRPFAELPPYYAAMDLGVILLDRRPNHERALPNKLFDYMAHGVAVLVPDYPAMGAIIRSGMSGWLLPEVGVDNLTTMLRDISLSGEAKERGHRGRVLYETKYCWDKQGIRFHEIVQGLVKRE